MTQENDDDIQDEGVTFTTTPKLTLSASATFKVAATADTATSFNIKTSTSVVGVDTFSFVNAGLTTSKKIGATVTYQCGVNAAQFDTSHLNSSYAYTKNMTFAYVNGMALRGKSIKFANTTDLQSGNKAALILMTVGSVAAPIFTFGVNQYCKNNDSETSAEKKARKAKEKLEDKKTKVAELEQNIADDNQKISELEQKKPLSYAEEKELKKLQDDVKDKQSERDSLQEEIDETEKKNQEDDDKKKNIGGSPDKETSQKIADDALIAGAGASVAATVFAAVDTLASFFNEGADKGIFMTASDGEFAMNATGTAPTFGVILSENDRYTTENASLKISDGTQKKAEFNSVMQFLASAGKTTSMVCDEGSVTLAQGQSSAKITSTDVELAVGDSSMKIKNNVINITVGAAQVKVEGDRIDFCDFKIEQ